MRPKQLARIGTFYLHEAVLDVLLEHHSTGYGLGPTEISLRAGIYKDSEKGAGTFANALVSGCLSELMGQNRVERRAKQKGGKETGWCLTHKEYLRRRDDDA